MVFTAYFKKLSKLLERTNSRTLTNYLLLRYATFWADDLGDEYDAVEAVSRALLSKCPFTVGTFVSVADY